MRRLKTKAKLVTTAVILFCAGALGCADPGLARHEPPTATPTVQPQQIHRIWAERICGSAAFEAAATAWDGVLEATPAPGFEALRDEMLRLVSFDLQATTSGAIQWLGLLLRTTTSSTSYWWGNPTFTAPPGVAEYHRTLFEAFRDFEPVLNYAEAEIRQAQSLDDLEATHASVRSAQEQMTAAVRRALASLGPLALAALQSKPECAFLLGLST